MADWLSSMQQTFEFYEVDPGTWKDKGLLNNVKSCTIDRDLDNTTLGSASFECSEIIGECYVRVYLVTLQNGVKERYPLGTFLTQTPSNSFDGKSTSISIDAYTPLLELKEKCPPIGYYLPIGADILTNAYKICYSNMRAPVIKNNDVKTLSKNFVSDLSDTWLTFANDLIAVSEYTFMLDDLGQILFSPKQDAASLQPVWTYTDDNSSILYPEMAIEHDMYGVPNTVEVVYSSDNNSYYAKVTNDDPNSPVSTVSRGRSVVYRETNPEITGTPSNEKLKIYATQLLRDLSSLEYTVKYTHGYCPVRIGDGVRLRYKDAGLDGVTAKVIAQSISCVPGCPVTETAVFTTNLWGW